LNVKHGEGTTMKMFRVAFDAGTWVPWAVAIALIAVGAALFRYAVTPMISTGWERARSVVSEKGIVV
jgi:hypothetical protein